MASRPASKARGIAMRWILITVLTTSLATAPALASAQATSSAEPFAVGTFAFNGQEGLGLVLRQQLVVELAAANNNLQLEPGYAKMPMPGDMIQLIGLYEYGLKNRLYEIVNHLVATKQLDGQRPGFIHDVKSVRTLAPIRYPKKILNAAGNFYTHTCEGCTPAAAGRERQEDPRQPRRPLSLPQAVRRRGHRQQRRGRHSPRPRPDRLGDRVRHGDRPSRPLRLGQPRRRLRVRLHGDHRHVRSRRAARQPHVRLVRRQGPRDVRAHGSLDRAEGVLRRSDETPPPAAHASTA